MPELQEHLKFLQDLYGVKSIIGFLSHKYFENKEKDLITAYNKEHPKKPIELFLINDGTNKERKNDFNQLMERLIKENKTPVYVHCLEGIERSVNMAKQWKREITPGFLKKWFNS